MVDDIAHLIQRWWQQTPCGQGVGCTSAEMTLTRVPPAPTQVAALEAADEVDEVAASIGAANTLVRQPGGTLKAYNTDWSAALDAVEAGLGGGERPLAGKRVVVLGAGGTGRAIAFGARQRGATVVVANRCGAGVRGSTRPVHVWAVAPTHVMVVIGARDRTCRAAAHYLCFLRPCAEQG